MDGELHERDERTEASKRQADEVDDGQEPPT